MEEARELMKGIKEDESISAATSLSEAAKFLGLKWNIQDANFHRKGKEEKVKDEIDLEKEKAQEADKKEQEEKKAAREKKRALRKSKTMSSVDMMKEASKIADKAKNEGEKDAGKGETPKPEAETPKEIAPEDEKKVKEIAEPKKETKAVKQEEITIHDIIKMKDLLKRTEDPSHANETKEINNKLEKIPELPKIKPKFPRIKPPVKKPLNPPATDAKSPVETLPVIQEKEAEVAAEAIPAKPEAENKEKEVKTSNAEDTVAISDDEESDIESPAKTEDTGAAATVESINSDSGLSESSKSKPAKDPLEDMADPEGKLTDFIQVPGFMICAEASDGRLAFMEWGPQGLHVHCLQFMHVTYDIVMRDTILNTMIPSKSPIVFLELTAEQTIIGRVYIKLWGQLRRAHNFLSLCLGDQGKSFLNTKFLQVYNVSCPGERILGGDYENNNGRGGRGVIDDLEWNGDYAMPMKEGMITAAGSGQNATNSLFLICTETDLERNFSCPFGLVCEGIKVVRDAIQETATKQIWITDCGVLITPPKFESSIQT
ncbi:UNVERIFIED_CONTAM: hypothetical protein GTU68_024055 [Idotea baltica]|nr:hypothetical protein [Idotea baltica]